MTIEVGQAVSTRYRCPMDHAHPDCWGRPHRGMALAVNDPAAWQGSIAFPRGMPNQQMVDDHLAQLAERGITMDDKIPVRYEFGVQWESADKVKPYLEILRQWNSDRKERLESYMVLT